MAIKLISLTCEKCGAILEVNSDLKKCTCNYCGNQILIDDGVSRVEHTHRIEGGYEFGYGKTYGELQARKDFADKVRREKQHELAERESLRREKEIENQQIHDELEKQKREKEKTERKMEEKLYKKKVGNLINAWIIGGSLGASSIYLIYLVLNTKQLNVTDQILLFVISAITFFTSIFLLNKSDILKNEIAVIVSKTAAYAFAAIALTLSTVIIYYNYSKLFSFLVLSVLIIFVFFSTPRKNKLNNNNIFNSK